MRPTVFGTRGPRHHQNLRLALRTVRKLLLTATPLQNNLGELYNLSSFIDERTFGDQESFRLRHSPKDVDLADLRKRLSPIVKRTLRKDVLEVRPLHAATPDHGHF